MLNVVVFLIFLLGCLLGVVTKTRMAHFKLMVSLYDGSSSGIQYASPSISWYPLLMGVGSAWAYMALAAFTWQSDALLWAVLYVVAGGWFATYDWWLALWNKEPISMSLRSVLDPQGKYNVIVAVLRQSVFDVYIVCLITLAGACSALVGVLGVLAVVFMAALNGVDRMATGLGWIFFTWWEIGVVSLIGTVVLCLYFDGSLNAKLHRAFQYGVNLFHIA